MCMPEWRGLTGLVPYQVMVTGGSEACINEVAIAGFSRLRALSTHNDDPAR